MTSLFGPFKAQTGSKNGKGKRQTRAQAVEFDVEGAIQELGPVPRKKGWNTNNCYSWAYHRHESLNKGLPPDVLKAQCRIVGKRVSAQFAS